jgi:rod shape-determining protein MreD
MRRISTDILITLLVVLLQTTVARFLAIGGLTPDLVLLWVVYLSIRRGTVAGTTAGFFAGLAVDMLSGADGMLGLAALAKTVAGFAAGYFYNDNKTVQTLGSYRFILIVALAAFLHNLIYFAIFLQGSDIGVWGAVAYYGLPAAAYTAAAALIPMFVFARRHPA